MVFAIGCFGYDIIGWVWVPEVWVVLGFDWDYLVDVFTTVWGWVGFWAVIGVWVLSSVNGFFFLVAVLVVTHGEA